MKIILFILLLGAIFTTTTHAPIQRWEILTAGPVKHSPEWYVRHLAAIHGVDLQLAMNIWWEESRKKDWSPESPAGALGAFQIMPRTGDNLCKNLSRWRTYFPHNARCGMIVINYARWKCRSSSWWKIAGYYNRGVCLSRPWGYALRVHVKRH